MAESQYADRGPKIEVLDQPIERKLAYDNAGLNLHATILSRLTARRNMSERQMKKRYESWARVDEHCNMFIDLTRKARNADHSTGDKAEMPWRRSIVVPMSYAIREVFLTQQMAIFTRRDPIIEMHGVGPEDIRPAKLMNAVMEYDQVQTNFPLELYTALKDGYMYNCGGFHDCWEVENGYKAVRPPPMVAAMMRMLGLKTTRQQWGTLRQFEQVKAFDPYNFFPDPRVSLSDLQKGEFIGHRVYRGYLELCANKIENGGNYFNVDHVKGLAAKPRPVQSRTRAQYSQMNITGSMDERDNGFHSIDSMVVNLIPSEWGLAKGTRPEKWQFAWADDAVIIRAHKADYDHGQYNYSAIESNIDTHVFGSPGQLENMDGLQRMMNWCFADDTEILTERGWSRFQDLTAEDKVATVSTDAERSVTFEKPSVFYEIDYEGDMVHFGGDGLRSRFDLLVTPDHQMWVQKRKAKRKRTMVDGNTVRVYEDQWWTDGEFMSAADVRAEMRIPNSVSWSGGTDKGALVLPAENSPIGRPGRPYNYPEMVIPYDILAPFIGWYVSEGYTRNGYVMFVQKNPKFIPVLDNLLGSFPKKFNRHVEPNGAVRWQLHDWRVARWLRENCGESGKTKKLPSLVSEFSPRLLRMTFQAAIDGDGHRRADGASVYHSTSRQLIDDMQIAALKLGFEASVRVQKRRIKEHHSQAYYLNIVEDGGARQTGGVKRVPYKGKVYCVQNSTHLLVVRRNGCVAVSGNCYNSHIQNLIRFINNRMIYSSLFVESFDVENPDAAMHVRLTALGDQMLQQGKMTIDQMIKQLVMTDVTTPMVQGVNQMFDFAMRMSGAADQMMGRVTADKRTLGEVQRVGQEGSNRMAMINGMIDVQAIRPLALRWASNRQQYTDAEMYVRIAGNAMREFGGNRVLVKPQDLHGNYDYMSRSGAVGPDKSERAQTLVKALEMIMKSQGILGMPNRDGKFLDPHEFIEEILRDSEVKDVEEAFYVDRMGGGQMQQPQPGMGQPQIQVRPDEEVEQMRDRGDAIPMRLAA